jgi:hypothetical protein
VYLPDAITTDAMKSATPPQIQSSREPVGDRGARWRPAEQPADVVGKRAD